MNCLLSPPVLKPLCACAAWSLYSKNQRTTICMFGMRPSKILPEYSSKDDFDLEWNKHSAFFNNFKSNHQGLAPPTGDQLFCVLNAVSHTHPASPSFSIAAFCLSQSISTPFQAGHFSMSFASCRRKHWLSCSFRLAITCNHNLLAGVNAGMVKDMLALVGNLHLLTTDTTLKDSYKMCEDFSTAQEPIHVYTATQLHIRYNVPLIELQVLLCCWSCSEHIAQGGPSLQSLSCTSPTLTNACACRVSAKLRPGPA